jgi:uncharacterized membrane protein
MGNDDNGSSVYNIVALNFAGEDTAKQNLSTMKSDGTFDGYDIQAECIVSQNDKGKVHIHEPGHGVWGATAGAAVGGLLGLLGGPAAVLALGASGAAIGGAAGHYWGRLVPKEDLEELGAEMTPNTSALLLILQDTETEGFVNGVQGYDANVVTLTVGDQLSGEIANYSSGYVTDADGNVVAAADAGEAADAEGDVAAAADEAVAS